MFLKLECVFLYFSQQLKERVSSASKTETCTLILCSVSSKELKFFFSNAFKIESRSLILHKSLKNDFQSCNKCQTYMLVVILTVGNFQICILRGMVVFFSLVALMVVLFFSLINRIVLMFISSFYMCVHIQILSSSKFVVGGTIDQQVILNKHEHLYIILRLHPTHITLDYMHAYAYVCATITRVHTLARWRSWFAIAICGLCVFNCDCNKLVLTCLFIRVKFVFVEIQGEKRKSFDQILVSWRGQSLRGMCVCVCV
eukprot:TRINITY_DN3272_c2_g1_i1.p5 TRINITY_DN3272_c2_g1~~TRINITY_DN3272_c2_g1_i1.p5  ORF type:complete len:257 (+),score=-5.87 TRINITY_DN3272_c2_g1_i1:1496-2266(+)